MPGACATCGLLSESDADRIDCVRCRQSYHHKCASLGTTEILFIKESGSSWSCCKERRVLRSNSASSVGPKSRNANDSAPSVEDSITPGQFNDLLSLVKNIAIDISSIKTTQEDIRSELARVNATLSDHSQILNEHSTAIADCRQDLKLNSSAISGCLGDIKNLRESHEAISQSVTSLQSRLDSGDLIMASTASASTTPTASEETIERLRRSHNVILSAVPESSDEEVVVRRIIDSILPSSSQTILSMSRLNASKRTSTRTSARPRLLKVTFSNIITPKILLRNKAALLTSEFRNISLRDDKTPHELQLLEALRGELKERQAAGERDLTIKYVKGSPKIVQSHSKN